MIGLNLQVSHISKKPMEGFTIQSSTVTGIVPESGLTKAMHALKWLDPLPAFVSLRTSTKWLVAPARLCEH